VPPVTVPPGPACRCPTNALSRSLSSPSHPGRYHRAPPRPGPARQLRSPRRSHRPRSPPSSVRVAMAPPVPDSWGPLPAALSYLLPRPGPPLSSFSRLHADAPTPSPLFPLCPAPPSCFSKASVTVPSLFHPFSSRPRLSHQSRAPPSRANILVALPCTGAPSSIGIWQEPPLSSLSSVHRPSRLSSPNPQPSLTSLADCRGPPEATVVIRAPSSRSSSSASTSPAQSGELPPSLGRPTHSPYNTTTLGLAPAAPRAPARRW
jgi:hypothetical protein